MNDTVYQDEILPLLRQVMEICKEHDIPALTVVEVSGTQGERRMEGLQVGLGLANPKMQEAATLVRTLDPPPPPGVN